MAIEEAAALRRGRHSEKLVEARPSYVDLAARALFKLSSIIAWRRAITWLVAISASSPVVIDTRDAEMGNNQNAAAAATNGPALASSRRWRLSDWRPDEWRRHRSYAVLEHPLGGGVVAAVSAPAAAGRNGINKMAARLSRLGVNGRPGALTKIFNCSSCDAIIFG